MKARFLSLALAVALSLVAVPAAMAQEEEASFDPASIPEVNQDEALILLLQLQEKLLAAGVAEEDLPAATEWLQGEAANLSEADVDELLAAQAIAEDDEFGQSEEDEPEMGDDEMGDADEGDVEDEDEDSDGDDGE